MKICITGSHFTPAQAVIDELKKDNGVEIIYIGRKYTREGDKSVSVESQVLPKLGVKFIPITTGRLQRSFTRYTIPSLFKIPFGFLQSFYLILKEKPDVILSFGGYVAVPVVISSWLLSIPIIIHEQTLVSGLANTISSFFANKIAISFEKNKSFEKCKTILTGNPMRKELFDDKNSEFISFFEKAKKDKLPVILITGGNQGSHMINESVNLCLENLLKIAFVIHQTGDSKFDDFRKLEDRAKTLNNNERYIIKKWIDGEDFGMVLKNADLAVSRAGINSLIEFAYFGVPTLIIPIPFLYKNEQMVNAKFFRELGLCEVLEQSNLESENLLKSIKAMLGNLEILKNKASGAKSVVIEDAGKRLALETILLANGR